MRFFNKYFFIGLGSGIILVIGLIFLAGYLLTRAMDEPRSSKNKEAPGLQPPSSFTDQRISLYEQSDGWSVRTFEGEKVELADYKGKVVFLNLWATWCPPCVMEMPSIQNLYNSLKDEDIAFLIISKEEKETVQKFVEEKEFNFPVYLSKGKIPATIRSRSIPATIILDREGVIVFKHIGSAKWDDESCSGFLRSLL